ncbi:hypothetical protein [Streptomyces sp. NPDC024089]|uniref:phage tail protein n=1 Tax=Streptomyces sp. NPDC024089 TaxID=3154328 RepID=UPI003402FFF6
MKAVPEKDPAAARTDVSRTTTAPERPPVDRPPGDRPAPDPRTLQRLQRAAGNSAVSRLVAQRYTAPVKPSPAQAPGFRKVKSDVAAKKIRLAHHAPAATESKSAQDAAVAPPDDKEAQGKAANAEKMNAAKPGEFNKQAFVDAVNKAIDSQAPKNLDQADKFSKSGKADKIKDEVDGKVKDGKDSSAKDIDTATKAPPDTAAAKDKPVTPMSPDQPPANPGAPSAADAVPEKQPASVTDFSQGPAANDQAMADAEVTEDQLAKGNEPEFDQALSTKKTAEADSAKAPAKGKAAEAQQLSNAKAGAAASGAQAMNTLTATRTSAGKQVDGGKGETKSKDEKKRAEVTAKLQKVYDGTKKDVETTLSDLDKKVDTAFTQGEKAARDAFTADHKRRMKKYKDKRYSGMFGPAKWAKDKLMGMPKEANDLFQEARKLYVAKMQTVISSVADIIGTELGKAKARIAKGRAELKAEVDKLPADLREFGQEAATDFAGKFDDLEATVNEKSEQLVQDLAQKYTAALNKVDEEIKKLQEANKGLVDKAKDAIVGVIKTINELKNLLLGILAKAASAIMKIIKDPIRFLGNLVRAVGAGLNLFVTNIATHLKTGVVSWLLGTAVKAGLELPQKFDLKGIIQLIGSLLGLTWDNIRARITRKGIPDQAMTAVESSVPVAKKLATEGPAGAVKEITEEAGDLKATILEKLTSYLIPTVIIAGITWIISLLNPASAFVRAVKGIIDIVTFIVNQGAQIVEFVNAVLDAVIAIANGGSASVPKMVETALAASVPLLIGFLASLLGIGSLANKVKSVFHAVAKPVNRAIDKIVNFIAKKGKALWNKLKGKGQKNPNDEANDKNAPLKPEHLAVSSEYSAEKPNPELDEKLNQVQDSQVIHDTGKPPAKATQEILKQHKDARFNTGTKTLTLPSASGIDQEGSLEALGAKVSNQTGAPKVTLKKSKGAGYEVLATVNPTVRVAKIPPGTSRESTLVRIAIIQMKIIPFLKAMAGNTPVEVTQGEISGKVDMDLFEKAWDDKMDGKSITSDWIKNRFRGAMSGHHEWIPSNYIMEVTKRARDAAGEGIKWIDLQHELRNRTFCIVFSPDKAPPEIRSASVNNGPEKEYSLPYGHTGAVYFEGSQRITYEEDFHKSLRAAFTSSTTVKGAAQAAWKVAQEWVWDGSDMDPEIHPDCRNRRNGGARITGAGQEANAQLIKDEFSKHI